jgi:thiamine pyrophosphokinase
LALMYNPTSIDIFGATGSRLDHVLANIHLLMIPMQLEINACIIDKSNKIYLKKDSFSLKKSEQFGDYVSLLPFSEKVNGLTLKGFKYPLDHITLSAGNSLGISNEIWDDEAMVDLSEGILIVIESRD